jgi:hypothetical protein
MEARFGQGEAAMTGFGRRWFSGSRFSSTFAALAVALVLTAGPVQTAEASAPTSITATTALEPEKGLAIQTTGWESTGAAASAEPTGHREVDRVRDGSRPPAYRPPRRGSPRARVGGGLRGALALPTPLALAPEHVGQTVFAQPSLFWHLDGSPGRGGQFVFTLIDEEGIDPLVEARLAAPERSGIWRIRLADYGVRLEPGTEYQWSVALIADPARRSKDVVSTGYIRRVATPGKLELGQPGVGAYADLGLWYDALESISDAIDASPNDPVLRGHRNALLRQAKLDAAIE